MLGEPGSVCLKFYFVMFNIFVSLNLPWASCYLTHIPWIRYSWLPGGSVEVTFAGDVQLHGCKATTQADFFVCVPCGFPICRFTWPLSGFKWIIMWERLWWGWTEWLGSYVLKKSQLLSLRIGRFIATCYDPNVCQGLMQSSNILKARLIFIF